MMRHLLRQSIIVTLVYLLSGAKNWRNLFTYAELEFHKLLRHVSTRWLSLGPAINPGKHVWGVNTPQVPIDPHQTVSCQEWQLLYPFSYVSRTRSARFSENFMKVMSKLGCGPHWAWLLSWIYLESTPVTVMACNRLLFSFFGRRLPKNNSKMSLGLPSACVWTLKRMTVAGNWMLQKSLYTL